VAVTINSPVKIGRNRWKLSWSSDLPTPTYYVWKNGTLVATTTYTEMDFSADGNSELFVDVFDSATDAPALGVNGRVTLGWQPVSGATSYRIEEKVSGVWTARMTITSDGRPWYSYQSRFLEDVTTHEFRVYAVSAAGNDSTAVELDVLMVRCPDAPKVTGTYSATTDKLTITAAAT